MFASLESFSIFFFASLTVIILAIIFEEKLIALEKRIDKKIASKKAAKRQAEIRRLKMQRATYKKSQQISYTNERNQRRNLAA